MEQNLGYQEFMDQVRERTAENLDGMRIGEPRLGKVVKNNGVVLDILTFHAEKEKTSPVIAGSSVSASTRYTV